MVVVPLGVMWLAMRGRLEGPVPEPGEPGEPAEPAVEPKPGEAWRLEGWGVVRVLNIYRSLPSEKRCPMISVLPRNADPDEYHWTTLEHFCAQAERTPAQLVQE